MNLDAFDLLATSILLIDAQGDIQYANGAAENLLGRSRKVLQGVACTSLVAESAELDTSLKEACAGQFIDRRQLLNLRKGHETTPVFASIVALYEQPWPVMLELREIEQQLLAERNQQMYEQAGSSRELLRNLAHEVKNPLGGVRGAAQLLEAELDDRQLKEYTQVIISEADRLQSLVDRLLAPQRAPLHFAMLNIHELCEKAAMLVRAEFSQYGLDIRRDYDASIPDFPGDGARLMQVLLNVIRNAAQVLCEQEPPGGLITLRTRVARQQVLMDRRHRLVLVVSVIDNGPGVPPEIQERVFHPLVTGRASGTGLGLNLAQDFVQQHGGVVEFESEPGHTEFRILLPMERP